MQFAVYCLDKPGHVQVRADNRNAHIEHLTRHPDRAALDRFLADDPYAKAGLFQSVTVKPFRKVFPKSA